MLPTLPRSKEFNAAVDAVADGPVVVFTVAFVSAFVVAFVDASFVAFVKQILCNNRC